MKTKIIITAISGILINLMSAQDVTFVARSAGGQSAQIKAGKEVIWTEDNNPDTSLLRLPSVLMAGYEPYANCRLLASASRGADYLVALEFALDKKHEKTKGMVEALYHMAGKTFEEWNGKLLFIRRFQRDAGGKWKIALSVLPSTFSDSMLNEELKSIQIENDSEFSVIFKRQWRIDPPTEKDYFGRNLDKKAMVDPAGETKLSFKFDAAHRLLLFAKPGDAKDFLYPIGARWWSDFDEWDVSPFASQAGDKWDEFFMDIAKRAKVPGVKYEYNNSLH